MQEIIKKINEVLLQGEPNNYSKDHKGYSGYKPQAVIDAVNSELSGKWSTEVLEKREYVTGRTNKSGGAIIEAFVHVRVTIEGVSHEAMASNPILDDFGDAYKSAQTDAVKKALSLFSIGNRAYHGLLEEKDTTSTNKSDDLDF